MIKGASMFASAGIAETYFKKAGIDIVVANELLEKRGQFYSYMYPNSKMIIGDINNEDVKNSFINSIGDDVKFLIATPPCQGISNLGKNRNLEEKLKDPRNYLVFNVLDVIDKKDFDYILMENVPGFLTIKLPYKENLYTLEEILKDKYSEKYNIDTRVLNAKDYGVPQSRPRAIIKMYKKGLTWKWPEKQPEITLRECIGDLPSLESGEKSNIKYHYARIHDSKQILWMKHTPTGCSAHNNINYFPVKSDGTKIKGYNATYKRMNWDAPASAVTMRNDAISSQDNVHPGHLLPDGTYSDARVLSLLELFRVSSLPDNWNIPEWATDTFIRRIIGEGVPPKLTYNIVKGIDENND